MNLGTRLSIRKAMALQCCWRNRLAASLQLGFLPSLHLYLRRPTLPNPSNAVERYLSLTTRQAPSSESESLLVVLWTIQQSPLYVGQASRTSPADARVAFRSKASPE